MSNRSAYQKFCREIPNLPIFMEPWYLEAAQEQERWDAVLVWEGDRVMAALPYFVKKQAIFKAIVLPVFVKYLGPVLHPSRRLLKYQHRYYAQLIDQLPRVDCFKQNFHPGVTNWLPFYWAGFQQSTRYTYRLAVEDLESAFSGIAGNKRREINKAGKKLRLVHDLAPEAFYRVNKMSFDRQGISIPYRFDQFYRHHSALVEQEAGKMFFALDEQQNIHSVAYLIWDRQRAYFHLAGDDPTRRKSYAGFWLIWKCIAYTSQTLGLKEFDFEGSMLPDIEPVRRRFGAHQVPYSQIWKYNSSLYQILDLVKNKWPY